MKAVVIFFAEKRIPQLISLSLFSSNRTHPFEFLMKNFPLLLQYHSSQYRKIRLSKWLQPLFLIAGAALVQLLESVNLGH